MSMAAKVAPQAWWGSCKLLCPHNAVDDYEGAEVLSLEAYGGDDESSWLLLEQVAE